MAWTQAQTDKLVMLINRVGPAAFALWLSQVLTGTQQDALAAALKARWDAAIDAQVADLAAEKGTF
jgi:hypothetical protein